jgi:CubicO group peptidase (beta-lactamase class C family)
MLRGFPPRFLLAAFDRRSNISRALDGSTLAHDDARIYARDLEVPSGGGVCTARGIARAYGEFASGGGTLGLRAATLDALAAPAQGLHDECLMADGVTFSLGFMKHCPVWPFGGPASYGSPGAGGALGFADPEARIGYAYVTCRMGTSLTGDPREVALREATYDALRRAG